MVNVGVDVTSVTGMLVGGLDGHFKGQVRPISLVFEIFIALHIDGPHKMIDALVILGQVFVEEGTHVVVAATAEMYNEKPAIPVRGSKLVESIVKLLRVVANDFLGDWVEGIII